MNKDKQAGDENSRMIDVLRRTLLGAGALMLLGLILGGYAITNYLGQVAFHHNEIEHLGQLRIDASLKQRKLDVSTELLPGFQDLQQQGVVGALAKTLEADRFERAVVNHPANILSFAMGALDPIAAPPDLTFSSLGLGRHELTFTAEPRHEVHLLRLLGQLPSALGGLSLLRSCDITRSIGVRSQTDTQSGIRAQCAIDWYVFGQPATTTSDAMDLGGAAP